MNRITEVVVYCIVVACMWIGGAQMATAQSEEFICPQKASTGECQDLHAGQGQMSRQGEQLNADVDEPPANNETSDAEVMACYVKGARQAWGGFAAFQGATPEFKHVSLDEWKNIFAEAVTHPDAHLGYIFVADGFDQADMMAYEKDAYFGWRVVKQLWMPDGKTNPGYSELVAIFSDFCKKQIGDK